MGFSGDVHTLNRAVTRWTTYLLRDLPNLPFYRIRNGFGDMGRVRWSRNFDRSRPRLCFSMSSRSFMHHHGMDRCWLDSSAHKAATRGTQLFREKAMSPELTESTTPRKEQFHDRSNRHADDS